MCGSASASRRRRSVARTTCCRGCRRRERELLDVAIVTAADAVEVLLAEGPDAAMRTVQRRIDGMTERRLSALTSVTRASTIQAGVDGQRATLNSLNADVARLASSSAS